MVLAESLKEIIGEGELDEAVMRDSKHLLVLELLCEVNDPFVDRFFNKDSLDMLDDKIEVLQALINGKAPGDIPKYYDVLEDYPRDYVDETGCAHEILWDL